MKYKYALFDFDGTLNETGPGIFAATRAVMREFGIPDIPDSVMRGIVGPPLMIGFPTILKMDESIVPLAVERYREIAKTVGVDLVKPYPGILDTLAALKNAGVFVGIVTSKVTETANEQIDLYGFRAYIDYLCGAKSDGSGLKTELLREALEELGVDKKDVVMIGDRFYDICGAVDNGVDSIGVLYGYGSESELREAGATYLVSDARELCELLLT